MGAQVQGFEVIIMGYIGIMEKKMETTIMGNMGGCHQSTFGASRMEICTVPSPPIGFWQFP